VERLSSPAPAAVPPPVARQRNIILAVLVGLAVVGWVVFLDQARRPDDMGMDAMGPDLTMGGSWPLFLGMWVAMMMAMMFPAAAPMVLMYGRMRRSDPTSVSLFTGSYIVLWFAFGAAAYLLSAAVETGAERSEWVASNWGRAGGALLVLAGLYQLSPLKEICLRQCRTPMSFVMTRWRDGRGGAVRMGLTHGLYCMGCCWMLFVVLIPLGLMNIAAMVAVAALVFAEKVLPRPRVVGGAAAAAMIAIGLAVMVRPSLLPTVV
jgi:predicted metal-binding membrane protein